MPWTHKQARLLLSKVSPLAPEQKAKMHAELHANPKLGHARKGSKRLSRASAARLKMRAMNG